MLCIFRFLAPLLSLDIPKIGKNRKNANQTNQPDFSIN